MSKDRKKLLHIHSSVNDKQPTPASLEIGELGVNNASGNAFISTKNSDGEVVRFSEDDTIIDWIEFKEVFPYEGYVRGANTGVTGVTEADLLQNKSNIVLKINQVAARNSEYDEKINGAKDIYGNLVNPISPDGYRDGAGIAIDMSPYVMMGSNPSFSSVTTSCHAVFNGTTEFNGTTGDCGSRVDMNVDNVCIDVSDTLNEYGAQETNIGVSCDGSNVSDSTTVKGKKVVIESSEGTSSVDINACTKVGITTDNLEIKECEDGEGKLTVTTSEVDVNSCGHNYVTTDDFKVTECADGNGKVTIDTTDVEVSATTTEIKSCEEITMESDNLVLKNCSENGKLTVTTNDLCLVGETKANLYGDETNVGLDCVCDGSEGNIADKTRMFGKGILITNKDICSAATEDGVVKVDSTNDVNVYAASNICNTAESAATLYGVAKTNVGISCDGTTLSDETMVRGGKTVIDASTSNLGLTAKGDILESAEGDIVITSNNTACVQAGDTATLYGYDVTRIGISCDGENTTNSLEVGGKLVCLDADNRASVYGERTSDLGISCDESKASDLTRVKGKEVLIENFNGESDSQIKLGYVGDVSIDGQMIFVGDVANTDRVSIVANDTSYIVGEYTTYIGSDGDDYIGRDVDIDAKNRILINCSSEGDDEDGDVYIQASRNICNEADMSYFYGENGTIIGAKCDDTVSSDITYYRTPQMYHSQISAQTVDEALDEVFNRSKVSIVQTPNPSGNTGETLITYTLYQDGQSIGDINLPKDHLIEDARVLYGIVTTDGDGNQTFTPCASSSDCKWYIELKWYVWDGSHVDKYTYLPVDEFVKDIDSVNTDSDRGVNVNVWYDSVSGTNLVSADTKLHFSNSTLYSGFTYERNGGEHYISGNNLTFVEGPFSAVTYQPFGENKRVKIPTSMQHLSQFNGQCYEFDADVCMGTHTIVANAFYNTSDINLKENIADIEKNDYSKVDAVDFKSFNFKSDESKSKKYGVIAQDVEKAGLSEILNRNDDGTLSVDYIQLLILKISSLENEVKQLKEGLNNK